MAEGRVCSQHTTHEWGGGGGLGGVLPQNIFEARKYQFLHSEHHKFAPKLMLTILVFEIKEGKNAQKVKKNINHNLSLLIRGG